MVVNDSRIDFYKDQGSKAAGSFAHAHRVSFPKCNMPGQNNDENIIVNVTNWRSNVLKNCIIPYDHLTALQSI